MNKLDGKIALITGGTSGIGAATAQSMIRLLLLTACILTLVFAAALAVIRAQPHADNPFAEILSEVQSCTPTCFMDVRLGVTTADEALAILQAHPWVKQAFVSTNRLGENYIVVEWSGQQPALMNSALVTTFFVDPKSEVVDGFRMITQATLGDLWLSLGVPQAGELVGKRAHYAIYLAEHASGTSILTAYSVVDCPHRVRQMWQSSLMISVTHVADIAYPTQSYNRASWKDCLFSGD